MNLRFLFVSIRLLLSLIFLTACAHKILFPETFALAIYRYQILPDALINLTAITLPWIELVAAVVLIASSRFRDAAATLMIAMLTVFTLAIAYNLLRGLNITCGCFSTTGDAAPISWINVLRNLGCIFLAFIVLFEEAVARQFEPLTRHPRPHGSRH
jgi:cobalt-zinc-cadmium efflux system protein